MATGTGENLHRRTRFEDKDSRIELISNKPILFDKTIQLVDTGGANGGSGGVAIAGLPQGDLILLGGILSVRISEVAAGLLDTTTYNVALGSVVTNNDNITFTGTEIDFLTLQTTAAAVGGVASLNRAVLNGTRFNQGAATSPLVVVNNNSVGLTLFLNVGAPDAGISASSAIRVQGSLRIAYVGLGKNA